LGIGYFLVWYIAGRLHDILGYHKGGYRRELLFNRCHFITG
jgi:hypothetical protein